MKSISFLFTVIFLSGVIYFSEAKGQFIVGDTLSSSITYLDFPDTILPFVWRNTSRFEVDIDFDGVKDVSFKRSHMSSPAFESNYFTVQSLNSVQFVCQPGTINADSLPPGTLINGSLSWNLTAAEVLLYFWHWQIYPPPNNTTGGICHDTSLYIAARKISGNDTIYSWFFFDNLNTFKIRSCAISKIYSFPPTYVTVNVGAPNQLRFSWKPPVQYPKSRFNHFSPCGGLWGYNIYGKQPYNAYQKLNTDYINDTVFDWEVPESGHWIFHATTVYQGVESDPSNYCYIYVIVSVPEPENLPEVILFPNPADTEITIEAPEKIVEIVVYRLDGGEVSKIPCFGNSVSIPVAGMGKGIFQVRITTGEGVICKKLVVN